VEVRQGDKETRRQGETKSEVLSSPDTPSNIQRRPAVFLDRDGVLNRDSEDFIKTPDELELLPGVPEAVARLNEAGYLLVVITNQSGIGRGLFEESALEGLHGKLRAELGVELTGIYYCPHAPEAGCDCRKPSPGMLHRAAAEHGIDLTTSYVVGDRPSDIACGLTAGCKTVLVLTGKTVDYDFNSFRPAPDYIAADLTEAVNWILEERPMTNDH
jgi:histidinol-phosphate phosphatase family protein